MDTIEEEQHFLLQKGLQLIVDGVKPYAVRRILENYILSDNRRGKELLVRCLILEGIAGTGIEALEAGQPLTAIAEAVFARAVETDKLDLWSDMLELLAMAVKDPALPALIDSPKLDLAQMTELMLDMR